ncbi:hypothetical protein BD311DRAFT_759327 [Dichomitus squalens]|uniref:Uncharacterized protein n=1 Tax=Dichomitus squalens TaxID=114155 RepID=A0A4Q9MK81_9APHY|nr:hypothetical protein BD311DRAFT_759327 [Dichomitus squalens]
MRPPTIVVPFKIVDEATDDTYCSVRTSFRNNPSAETSFEICLLSNSKTLRSITLQGF